MRRNITFLFLVFFSQISKGQNFASLRNEASPLHLKAIGSFYLGGEKQVQNSQELGGFSSDGTITVNQMYVSYLIPEELTGDLSFVLIHGMNLSGKTWETTPDGNMGWNEYLVRKGYPVYLVDQVGAGRSGFNQKNYNLVKNGTISPNTQEAFQRISDDNTWINFRFGLADGQVVDKAKFPIESADEFSKQSIPFSLFGLPSPNPNYMNLSELARELKHTILVSHSQSGAFPIETALIDTTGIKAIVMLEPGGTGAQYTDEQVRTLTGIPILVIYGDNIENETGITGHSWKNYYDGWSKFSDRVNSAGGKAETIYLPDVGLLGNSHMLMMDQNNQQLADLILSWLDKTY